MRCSSKTHIWIIGRTRRGLFIFWGGVISLFDYLRVRFDFFFVFIRLYLFFFSLFYRLHISKTLQSHLCWGGPGLHELTIITVPLAMIDVYCKSIPK